MLSFPLETSFFYVAKTNLFEKRANLHEATAGLLVKQVMYTPYNATIIRLLPHVARAGITSRNSGSLSDNR